MYINFIIMALIMNNSLLLFDFTKSNDISNWRVVNDVVMGGKSNGMFQINTNGYGEFKGDVSLENNGGFSYLRYRFNTTDVSKFTKVKIRLKGDGKKYQFRVKPSINTQQSYIFNFNTTGDWQTIEIELANLIPFFRGYPLNMPNYSDNNMEELGFLIGNKKNESFCLLLHKISLE